MRRCEECGYLESSGEEYPESYCPLVSEEDPKFAVEYDGITGEYIKDFTSFTALQKYIDKRRVEK